MTFWFIKVEVARPKAGTYSVVDREELAADEATVVLSRAVYGKNDVRVPAVAGQVVIGNVLWESGAELTLKLTADFPESPVKTLECNTSTPAPGSGATASQTCLCERADGSQVECIQNSTAETCCRQDPEGSIVSLSVDTAAPFCADMCSAVVGLQNHCS